MITKLVSPEGHLFYYAEEKPIGSPKEINWGLPEREQLEEIAIHETLNRIARHADRNDSDRSHTNGSDQ